MSDLAQFTIAFINNGKLGRVRVLPPPTIKRLSTPYVPFLGYWGHYGYGLRIDDHRGLRIVEHGGQTAGFGSLLYMVPDQRFAVIILANLTAAGRLYSVGDAAIDAVLRTAKPSATNPFAEEESVGMTAEEAARHAGVYANAATVELVLRGTQLFYKAGAIELPVTKTREHFFYVRPGRTGPPMRFVLVSGPDGRTEYLYNMLMMAHKRTSGSTAAPAK